jgi:hypothetical protein
MKHFSLLFLISVIVLSSCDFTTDGRQTTTQPTTTTTKPTTKTTKGNKFNSKVKNDNLASELEATKQELVRLQKLLDKHKGSFEIKEAKYVPFRKQQVQEYLQIMYEVEVKKLIDNGLPESVIDQNFKSFFTLKYCDDRILAGLDSIAERSNQYVASRIRVMYEKISVDSLSTKELLKQ